MTIDPTIIDRALASPHGEAAFKVCEQLLDAGHECWWVGGATRALLLGSVPDEIDMATSAKPEQVAALFKKSDLSAAALGAVIVSVQGHTFELTTFREDDAASDGRHPESVRFGSRQADALRRDATVNAIYWNPVSRQVFDPTGGVSDLTERLVRLIGDPVIRIRHDALRILRMVRLRATINGQYEPETYKALKSEAESVKVLSGMRIAQELEKILLCPRPSLALRDLFEIGVLAVILPELSACRGVAQPKQYHHEGDVWDHLLKCTESFTEDHGIDVRTAAFLHDIGKPQTFSIQERIRFDHHAEVSAEMAELILRRLQFTAPRINKIRWLISHHMMMGTFKDLSDERKAHWYFHPWFLELLQLFSLDIAGTVPADESLYDSIVKDYNEFLNSRPLPPKALLKGDEVMAILGIGPGEQVGKVLVALHDGQIREEITTKAQAREFLKKHLRI